MRMKSYFANSFRVAMERARKELGPEAVLVTSRTSALDARHLGEYEVVFATELPAAPDTEERTHAIPPSSSKEAQTPSTPSRQPLLPSPKPSSTATPGATSDLGAMLAEIQGLRQQLKSWRHSAPPDGERPSRRARYDLSDFFAELVGNDVDREIAQRLVSGAENRLRVAGLVGRDRKLGIRGEPSPDQVRMRAALTEEIHEIFQVDSRLPAHEGSPSMIALVGPPGAGKTATIAKLAVRHGLTGRKPAVLISLDTLRVGASEQLRCYAAILGLAFRVVETNRALEQSLEEHRNKELILIDTPGFTFADLQAGCESADFLAGRADIQKHLVLAASMRYADMSRMSAAYQVFRPSRLIFTRMDETESFGPLLNEAVTSGRPISFLSAGQKVPEDLAEAAKPDLSERLLRPAGTSPKALPVSQQAGSLQSAA